MAVPVGGPWFKVGKLIEIFTAMGCEVHYLDGHLAGPDGDHRVRFLYYPETDGFVSLSNLEDDDRVSPSEVENWERRLGLDIPKGL